MDESTKALFDKWVDLTRPPKPFVDELSSILDTMPEAGTLLKVAAGDPPWKPARWIRLLQIKEKNVTKLAEALGMPAGGADSQPRKQLPIEAPAQSSEIQGELSSGVVPARMSRIHALEHAGEVQVEMPAETPAQEQGSPAKPEKVVIQPEQPRKKNLIDLIKGFIFKDDDTQEEAPKRQPMKSEVAAGKDEEKEGPKKGLFIVIGVVILLLILAIGGYFWYKNSQSNYSLDAYDFSQPSGAQGFAPDVSGGGNNTTGTTATEDRWAQFMAINEKDAPAEPFLEKPEKPLDVIQNFPAKFPARWLLWLLFLWPIWNLLKQDRLAAEERTDVYAARRGLIALFVGVLLAEPIALIVQYVVNLFSVVPQLIPAWPFVILGIGLNIWAQYQAATAGRTDYSTLSIAGFFFTGALIVWWYTPNIPMILLGALFMIAGIVLQSQEMSRTHQGWKAHISAVIMILIFVLITGLFYWLLGLVPPITATMPWIVQFALAVLYATRAFLGAIVGLLVAYAIGDQITTQWIMPNVANGTVFSGRQENKVEMHGKRTGREPVDDFSTRWEVKSQYDAMAYAIMLLYPLTFLFYYIFIVIL